MGNDPLSAASPPPGAQPPPRMRGPNPSGCLFRLLFLAVVLGAIFMAVWLLRGAELINAFRALFDTFG